MNNSQADPSQIYTEPTCHTFGPRKPRNRRSKNCFSSITCTLVVLALSIFQIVINQPTAHAAADPPARCFVPNKGSSLRVVGQINIINVKTGPKYASYNHGPDWEVSGIYPETLSISRTLTYTNSYSSTVNVSSTAVSQALGFTVSEAISTQVGATFPVPHDGKYWVLQAGTQDFPMTFDLEEQCGTTKNIVGHGTAVKTGRVITRNQPSN
jgi:hypothetical protein